MGLCPEHRDFFETWGKVAVLPLGDGSLRHADKSRNLGLREFEDGFANVSKRVHASKLFENEFIRQGILLGNEF